MRGHMGNTVKCPICDEGFPMPVNLVHIYFLLTSANTLMHTSVRRYMCPYLHSRAPTQQWRAYNTCQKAGCILKPECIGEILSGIYFWSLLTSPSKTKVIDGSYAHKVSKFEISALL